MKARITNISSDALYIPSFYRSLAPGESVTAERTAEQVDTDTVIRTYLVEAKISLTWGYEANDNTVVQGQVVPIQDLIVYLDAVNGDDTHDGTTPATAIQTMDEAVRRLPLANAGKLRWNLAAGSYVAPSTRMQVPLFANPNTQNGEPLVVDGSATFTQVGAPVSITAPDAMGAFLTFSALVTLPRGALIKWLTGANAGQWASIDQTAAGSASLLQPVFGPISIGETFAVFESGVTIDSTTSPQGSWSMVGAGPFRSRVAMIGLKLRGWMDWGSVRVGTDRCDFDTVGNPIFPSYVNGEWINGPFNNPSDLFDFLTIPAGNYIHGRDLGGNGGSLIALEGGHINVALVMDDTMVVANNGSDVVIGLSGNNCPVSFDTSHGGLGGFSPSIPGRLNGIVSTFMWNTEGGPTPAPPGAIYGVNRAHLGFIFALQVQDNQISGIVMDYGSRADLYGPTTAVGHENTGHGIRTINGGYVSFDDSASTTVTGTVDQVDLGGVPYTLAAIQAAAGASALDVNGSLLGRSSVTDSRGNTVALQTT